MNKIIDISSWQSGDNNLVPIGKRIKKVVTNPNDEMLYYFKEPKEKYPWEFWNEIIAYEIGIQLGFNTLKYCVALLDDTVGCLSPSMTDSEEELIHGQQFLTQIYPSFETKKGIDHNFQLIKNFFESNLKYNKIMDSFIEMLIFDSIIGNRDRHQQNWALIRKIDVKIEKPSIFDKLKKNKAHIKIQITENINFSKLFDNGNCLAYNIIEESIDDFINNEEKRNKYIFGEKATSHVRWDGDCIPHLDLLTNIYEHHNTLMDLIINKVHENYSKINISDIINSIDNGIIFANKKYNLTDKRKKIIIILIETRIQKLFERFKK
jgi:hypothetical protein